MHCYLLKQWTQSVSQTETVTVGYSSYYKHCLTAHSLTLTMQICLWKRLVV